MQAGGRLHYPESALLSDRDLDPGEKCFKLGAVETRGVEHCVCLRIREVQVRDKNALLPAHEY